MPKHPRHVFDIQHDDELSRGEVLFTQGLQFSIVREDVRSLETVRMMLRNDTQLKGAARLEYNASFGNTFISIKSDEDYFGMIRIRGEKRVKGAVRATDGVVRQIDKPLGGVYSVANKELGEVRVYAYETGLLNLGDQPDEPESLNCVGGRVHISNYRQQAPVAYIQGKFTEEPTLVTEIVGDKAPKPSYTLDNYRQQIYMKEIYATDGVFPRVHFNDIRLYENFSFALIFCQVSQRSRVTELETLMGDQLLACKMIRLQFNEKVPLSEEVTDDFMYDQYSRIFPGKKLSYRQWLQNTQILAIDREVLMIENKPGEVTQSNLNITVQPSYSKWWKRAVEFASLYDCTIAANLEVDRADVAWKNPTEVKWIMEHLYFDCKLVLVYNDRSIQISQNGQIVETLAPVAAPRKEPTPTVPGTVEMRTGYDPMATMTF